MDVEFRIMKPNKKFELDVRDIEIIEQALRAKAGRRGMAIASGETSKKLKEEMQTLEDLNALNEDKLKADSESFILKYAGTAQAAKITKLANNS